MDQAGYKQNNHSAYATVQVLPTDRIELFASTSWNSGNAAIRGMNYDAGALAARLPGLDFTLMNQGFPTFSDLKVRQYIQSAGVNYRLRSDLVLNLGLEYNDYNDEDPYVYDTTGRYVTVLAGLNWIF